MFDCGENVQRQMMQAKVSFHRKMKIFITHLHGDHVLGFAWASADNGADGPQRTRGDLWSQWDSKIFWSAPKKHSTSGLNYPVEINQILAEGVVCDEEEYSIVATKSNHAVESYAFAFVEKPRPGKFYPKKAQALGIPAGELWSRLQRGEEITLADGKLVKPSDVMGPLRAGRKIVYTGDTKPFEAFAKFAEGADLVIHDCTFDDSLIEKAGVDGHSTPSQAAGQAKAAGAKQLGSVTYQRKVPKRWAAFGTSKKSLSQHRAS